jgi:hypothetical protein
VRLHEWLVLTLPDHRLDLVRWIHFDADPFESVSEQDRETRDLSTMLHDRLGYYFWRDRCLPKLWWPRSMSILPWIY